MLGLNGQGKSSFIQSLLILRQSNEKLNKGILLLNGDLIRDWTNSKDALYQYAKDKLSINLEINDQAPCNMIFDYERIQIFLLSKRQTKS